MKVLRYILYAIIAIFFLIQFIPSDLPANDEDVSNDLIHVENPPNEVAVILKKACYDCHSNQTRYPWYSYVAPISWLVSSDTKVGRGELNLSDWAELSKRKKIKTLTDISEEVEKRNMPLKVYTVIHRDAILSDEEIKTISDWTKNVSNQILGD